ncbi:MAG: methylmalonyl Co-A mutase-associated GTPase MeaB [Candidatus Marinimicrobia bacterium]|nr:methylmalonyl Co-A mutase-associated GTPase MeaB [Candidatus Neomarinimicrobiota bacterium]MCH7954701.1 methylmalonyl Co-A mutase-associated GTPase MeaB [Candidatus Neomarinimicrobiota bacterium]
MPININDIYDGDIKAVARAISVVENGGTGANELIEKIYPNTGNAHRIGITGPSGAGKSTLVDKLTHLYRKSGKMVGIVAIDPTSPFTGGALLGDRLRLQELSLNKEVFFRSMANRGSRGGISRKTGEVVDILDSSGKDVVMIETVGVGQSELDIAGAADTTIVVLVPESGDEIQVMKAGLMEIADIFVLNKSDREGADLMLAHLSESLKLRSDVNWLPKIVKTSAIRNEGIEELMEAIEEHSKWLSSEDKIGSKRNLRLINRVKEIIVEELNSEFWTDERMSLLENMISDNGNNLITPYKIVEDLKKV